MSCKFDKQLLYSMADNTIEPLEKIFVEEHLKYCSECKKEFELIKELDKELGEFEFELELPERLSTISQLIVENCISEIENENEELKVHNYNEEMKLLKKTIIEANKFSYNNPYNKFIERSLTKTISFIGKPVKNYYKKKISNSKIGKLFKVV
ncbi:MULTISPECIES: zf-HC2 domain-containing protein [unclassified Clostridium]|uniref:anti-sigma factor family protein n=1 Tax=unclassified Clostridium TaxID=2614128 RepID=UPI000298178A|nr:MULTISPECIES: zf-HC2 domain-containing protein [unclassified Clostridium]EKQ51251.1 MAG: hypothetical protein A370_04996 [Clostridium sp. Maddingley MBC34-26]